MLLLAVLKPLLQNLPLRHQTFQPNHLYHFANLDDTNCRSVWCADEHFARETGLLCFYDYYRIYFSITKTFTTYLEWLALSVQADVKVSIKVFLRTTNDL